MRISDWSSDVCSSDLAVARLHGQGLQPRSLAHALAAWRGFFQWWAPQAGMESNPVAGVRAPKIDRKSVVYGKSVAVRVALGGRRILKKKRILADMTRRHRSLCT